MATVTQCHYEVGAGQALAFGIPRTKRFQISFNYWANGQLHTGEFASAKPIPQGTLFPITYDPDAPHEHSHANLPGPQSRFFLITVAGLLFVVTLATVLTHGCVGQR